MPKNYTQYKDYYQKYNHEYYQKHKAEIIKKRSEPVQCEVCKTSVLRINLSRHLRTDIHYFNLKKQERLLK